jgi:hypothetical protein
MRRSLVFLFVALLGLTGAHRFQLNTDECRRTDGASHRQIFVPSPEATQVASMGFDLVVADLLWTRAVLLFVDFLDQENEHGSVWTRTVLQTVTRLDPLWRTPFFYGGSMLRLLNDLEGSDEVFTAGMEAFPEDAYFPFSMAMNAYLFRQDLEKATDYLTQAASLPNAPKWYRNAAAEFIHRGGQRKAAVKYLNEQIEAANSDKERALLINKRNDLLYAQIIEVVSSRQDKWEAHFGRTLVDVKVLEPLPPDPKGGTWIVGGDGRVRSSAVEPRIRTRDRNEERAILVNP